MELAQVTLIARGCSAAQARIFLGNEEGREPSANPVPPAGESLAAVRNGMLSTGFMRFPDDTDNR